MGGASPGPAIGVSYIIEQAPAQPVSLGAIARNWFGGTRPRANGLEAMSPIFPLQNLQIIDRPDRRKDWTRFRATRPSCCTRTDSAGFTCRKVCRTVHF